MHLSSQLITSTGSTDWERQPVAPTQPAALLPWPRPTRVWLGFESAQSDAKRGGGSLCPIAGSAQDPTNTPGTHPATRSPGPSPRQPGNKQRETKHLLHHRYYKRQDGCLPRGPGERCPRTTGSPRPEHPWVPAARALLRCCGSWGKRKR